MKKNIDKDIEKMIFILKEIENHMNEINNLNNIDLNAVEGRKKLQYLKDLGNIVKDGLINRHKIEKIIFQQTELRAKAEKQLEKAKQLLIEKQKLNKKE